MDNVATTVPVQEPLQNQGVMLHTSQWLCRLANMCHDSVSAPTFIRSKHSRIAATISSCNIQPRRRTKNGLLCTGGCPQGSAAAKRMQHADPRDCRPAAIMLPSYSCPATTSAHLLSHTSEMVMTPSTKSRTTGHLRARGWHAEHTFGATASDT